MNKIIYKCLKSDKLCIRYFGLKLSYINCISKFLETKIQNSKVGRRKKLSTKLQVLLFLYYLRRYCTYEELSLIFNVSISSVYRYIQFMTCIFNKFEFINVGNYDVILVDSTETEIERPKYNKIEFYGRKKMFSIKSQIIVDKVSKKILDVRCCKGSVHDFELFKNSYYDININSDVLIIADAGYQGINKYHSNSLSIIKKRINSNLDPVEKYINKCISKFRVTNEHVIGKLKFWKIIGSKFRHCKCMFEKFNVYIKIVSNLYNLNLD